MVKPIKMVEKKEEGKEKIQNMEVILEDVIESELPVEGYPDFVYECQTFKDIAGYQVNGDVLGIVKKEGGNIVIPMRRIRQIETSFADKE